MHNKIRYPSNRKMPTLPPPITPQVPQMEHNSKTRWIQHQSNKSLKQKLQFKIWTSSKFNSNSKNMPLPHKKWMDSSRCMNRCSNSNRCKWTLTWWAWTLCNNNKCKCSSKCTNNRTQTSQPFLIQLRPTNSWCHQNLKLRSGCKIIR